MWRMWVCVSPGGPSSPGAGVMRDTLCPRGQGLHKGPAANVSTSAPRGHAEAPGRCRTTRLPTPDGTLRTGLPHLTGLRAAHPPAPGPQEGSRGCSQGLPRAAAALGGSQSSRAGWGSEARVRQKHTRPPGGPRGDGGDGGRRVCASQEGASPCHGTAARLRRHWVCESPRMALQAKSRSVPLFPCLCLGKGEGGGEGGGGEESRTESRTPGRGGTREEGGREERTGPGHPGVPPSLTHAGAVLLRPALGALAAVLVAGAGARLTRPVTSWEAEMGTGHVRECHFGKNRTQRSL